MCKALPAALCVLCLCACVPEVVLQNEQGNAHYAQAAYEEALDAYRRAEVEAPERPEPHYNAANAYNRLGQVDETLIETQQALKSDDGQLQAQAWYNLGNAYLDAQRWADAIEAYREALRLDPDDMDAKHNLELALRELEQQEQSQSSQSESDESQEDEQAPDRAQGQSPQGPDEQETPTPSLGGVGGGSEQEPTPQPEGQPQGSQGMTREQAQRLLEALLGEAQTLQQRLQEQAGVPAEAPLEDW
ncbi:MAG: tetratricopeptide repeat protein [Anaerolineae bacterium]|nr:tetratricopeptide repeat protein [Anaerolineae bacterium]